MSIAQYDTQHSIGQEPVPAVEARAARPLHRLRQVREEQNISLRTVARRLDISPGDAEIQEDATTDLPISLIYQWQQVLEVPLIELLEDSELKLSPAVELRAQLVRVMKTAVTLKEATKSGRHQRLVQSMIDQLLEIMPELQDVGPWFSSGSQRGLEDLGRIADRRFDDAVFRG